MEYKYQTGVIGGTFDHLHEGHKAFLKFAFSLAKKVFVTITSDKYTNIHKPDTEPFEKRKKEIEKFFKEEGLLTRAEIISINDVYGITSEENISLEVIFVTTDSLSGAVKVNEKREKDGLFPLAIEVAPLVSSETGLPISSSYIRSGAMGKEGEILIKKNIIHETTHLPEDLRKTLQQPFGQLISNPQKIHFQKDSKIIAVGDVTTKILHEKEFSPLLSVVDFMVERKKQEESLASLGIKSEELVIYADNPPASLTPSLWEALEKGLENIQKGNKTIILVNGEEDLAVLPLLLLAPVGFIVCYGQPHEGMVIVPVSSEVKQKALELILLFTPSTTRGH